MIVVVFVPETFICPSVARSLPLMSRSATALSLMCSSCPNVARQRKRINETLRPCGIPCRLRGAANITGCVDDGAANLLH